MTQKEKEIKKIKASENYQYLTKEEQKELLSLIMKEDKNGNLEDDNDSWRRFKLWNKHETDREYVDDDDDDDDDSNQFSDFDAIWRNGVPSDFVWNKKED